MKVRELILELVKNTNDMNDEVMFCDKNNMQHEIRHVKGSPINEIIWINDK